MIAVAALTLAFAFAAIYRPVEGPEGAIRGEMTRAIALIPFALYFLYAFVQHQDAAEHREAVAEADASAVRPAREWGRLALALALIVAGVEGLVRAALSFGEILGTPDFLWGITVVAAGTSVPDAFVSVRAARGGKGLATIANVLGSNVFDLLVCIPAGVLIAGAAVIDFSLAAPMMGVLTGATVALFLALRTGMSLSRREGWGLLGLYALFLIWVVAESVGGVDLVPGLPP
jgi:cation:H+ antiporter